MKLVVRLLPLAALFIAAGCCPDTEPASGDGTAEAYEADIRWTAWGIPHIVAEDYGGLGYGMGYAFARDHFCVLADQVVMVHGERSRWFGPGEGDINLSTDLASFQAAHSEVGGIPWVHTMMADDQGNAWYIDSASTPNLTDDAEAAYAALVSTNYLASLFADYGVILVDGADPVYEWADDPDARAPGLVGYARQPMLLRDDYVYNANDNHWLTNPAAPLEGFPAIYGEERAPRTPRTRMNARYLSDDTSGDDDRFTLAELQGAALGGRGIMAELLRDEVVAACTDQPTVTATIDGTPQEVDLTAACTVLAEWDLRVGVDSQGAALWRELLGSGAYGSSDFVDGGALFEVPFDASDPVDTPNTLASDPQPALESLAIAAARLEQVGIALDAPLGDVQLLRKGTEDIAVLGGGSIEGSIAIATFSADASGALAPPLAGKTPIPLPETDRSCRRGRGGGRRRGASFSAGPARRGIALGGC